MEWESVIGLEIHVQLKTKSKLFSGASTQYGAEPNTQACIIDLGMPGVLPVLNKETVNMAIKLGLAINAKINDRSVFARKNYFYPDLPKGYQISQHNLPIVSLGYLDVQPEECAMKRIGITRAHLEEDAGKSIHENFDGMSGIDLNRAGIPLIEIVSEPDIRSAKEAISYMKAIHSLVRYLDISDANMQEGSFRCDANVSIRPKGQKTLGTRTEIKNVNSFRFVERAINYEIARQIEVIENDGEIRQETRLYDEAKDETRTMRTKEEAHDYRYFPDPDLLPIEITDEMIEQIRITIPELPHQKLDRFIKNYQLNAYDANFLVSNRETADYFENVVKETHVEPKTVANWIMGDLYGALNKAGISITHCPISTKQMTDMLKRIHDNTISGKLAKQVFEALWNCEGHDVDEIIKSKGLTQISDTTEIEKIIDEVLSKNQNELTDYKNGKTKLFGFFVGQVMKLSKGKANPKQVNDLLKIKLQDLS